MSAQLLNKGEVLKALAKIIERDAVFEVRALDAQLCGNRRIGTVSGYFDNPDTCVSELEKLTAAKGIYITANPINRALLARRANRLDYAERNATTNDQHILRRHWFLVDSDADRPSGISATDAEKDAAKNKACEIYGFLKDRGWTEPVVADSGNGYHLLYRVDLPASDDALLEKLLVGLSVRFDGDGVKIDRSVHNPARIVRLYGTLAAKGDNTKERPHRLSKILKAPESLQVVSAEKLLALMDELKPAAPPKVERPAAHGREFDVEAFFQKHAIAYKEKRILSDGREMWLLEACPFNPDHNGTEVAVFRWPLGKLGFQCKHSSDTGKGWKEFRRHFEPDYGSGSPPKVETRSAADNEQTDLTSLSSCAMDYPAPPDEAAYYGLAGAIVRRIEPQTEADPVALLVQTLVAFGNLIGRNAHAIADGSQHYTNLNTVLVGETAKGRKGTAWQQVRRVFAVTDKGWPERIVNGLSSGEGLIWAVRDPIEEKKPIKKQGRHTSEYETEVKDYGVEDKRLLVVEAEFAKVLKVMSREGNTLSPVIRSAWDDGNLRILTKTNPAHATDAHISIIGHITRGEARRNLTETESANGFANRFCFVAVKRSKCLPEGGEAVPIADLVGRLQEAIEFARSVGELRRSKEARELWTSVYPKLSAGKPGLLGMITARAEAQVLRLSNLYALLDCSKVVEVAHLCASLALWAYCERSAQWVFESGTGNKIADRILAALKAAGEKGLMRLQITNEVFTRNVSRFEIDEALRLLHHLQLAMCEVEKTVGRPCERWFYQPTRHEVNEESPPTDHKTGDTSYSSYASQSKKESPAGDTSYSSYVEPSQNANSAEADTDPGKPDSEVFSGNLQL